jgi:hypothetical protein
MKTILILAAVGLGGFALRDYNQREAKASRVRAEKILASMRQTAPAQGEERVWTQTQTGWVNHQAGVSPMQSQGLGGGYAGMPREPKKLSGADKAKAQFGWDKGGGTSLDR